MAKAKESFITIKPIQENNGEELWEVRSVQSDLPLGKIKNFERCYFFVAYQQTVFEKKCLRDIVDYINALPVAGLESPANEPFFNYRLQDKKTKTFIWQVRAVKSQISFGVIRWYNPWRCYGFYPNNGYHFNRQALTQIADFLEAEDTKQKEAARQNRENSPAKRIAKRLEEVSKKVITEYLRS